MSFPLAGRDAAAARQAERFFDAADAAFDWKGLLPFTVSEADMTIRYDAQIVDSLDGTGCW